MRGDCPLGASSRALAKFSDGSPAMIASKHGRGRTLMVGSHVRAKRFHVISPSAHRAEDARKNHDAS
ncbi:MAG TPA: hypothetical protein VFY40_06220 [Blastocatellia bacterium]|nr:hypothetical protein [Blastocatellia bacterium]